MVGNDRKIENTIKQGGDDCRRLDETCGQSCLFYGEKSLVPDCNTLADRNCKQLRNPGKFQSLSTDLYNQRIFGWLILRLVCLHSIFVPEESFIKTHE